MREDGYTGFKCFYKGKSIEVWAKTALRAREGAAIHFRCTRRPWDITVIACERPDGTTIEHSTAGLN